MTGGLTFTVRGVRGTRSGARTIIVEVDEEGGDRVRLRLTEEQAADLSIALGDAVDKRKVET